MWKITFGIFNSMPSFHSYAVMYYKSITKQKEGPDTTYNFNVSQTITVPLLFVLHVLFCECLKTVCRVH